MKLDVEIKDRRPKTGDIVAIKWKSARGQDGYMLSNHDTIGGKSYRLLNLNGESTAFEAETIGALFAELRGHSAVDSFEVFPQSEFKLTLQPIGGAE